MASEVLEAELRLTAKDATAAGLRSATGNIRSASSEIASMGLSAARALAGFATVGAAARGLEAIASNAIEADRGLTSLMITSGATAAEIEGAFSAMTLSAAQAHTSSRTLVGISNDLVAAGLSLEDATGSAASASQLATAYGASMADIGALTASMFVGFSAHKDSVGSYFDAVATGSKAGQIEVKDLAAHMADLSGSAQALGMNSLDGFQRLVAFSEVARATAGDSATAMNNVRNSLDKMMAPDVAKNFRKMGVDWNRALKDGIKNGKDLVEVLHDAVETATKGDMTKLTNLFPDAQARAAVAAIMGHWDQYKAILDQIRGSHGVVAADAKRAADTISGGYDRMTAALSNYFDMMSRWPVFQKTFNTVADGLERAVTENELRMSYAEGAGRSETSSALGQWFNQDFRDLEIAKLRDRLAKGLITPDQAKSAIQDYGWRINGGQQIESDFETNRADAYSQLRSKEDGASTPSAAAVATAIAKDLTGAFDGLAPVGPAASSVYTFDPVTRDRDPRLQPPAVMDRAGRRYTLDRGATSPLGIDPQVAEWMARLAHGEATAPPPATAAPVVPPEHPHSRPDGRPTPGIPDARAANLGAAAMLTPAPVYQPDTAADIARFRMMAGLDTTARGAPTSAGEIDAAVKTAADRIQADAIKRQMDALGPDDDLKRIALKAELAGRAEDAATPAALDALSAAITQAAGVISDALRFAGSSQASATTAGMAAAGSPASAAGPPEVHLRSAPSPEDFERARRAQDHREQQPEAARGEAMMSLPDPDQVRSAGTDFGRLVGDAGHGLMEVLRNPGTLIAKVVDPVKAELEGRADVNVRVQVDGPGRVAFASSTSSGHVRTNVGTSMPELPRDSKGRATE